jgi:hypothetical protein
VFGRPTARDAKLQFWLDQLRQADPATRRGALIHRNLLEDANVCAAYQREFRDFVAAQPTPSTPDETARQYETFLQQLFEDGHPAGARRTLRTGCPPSCFPGLPERSPEMLS